MNYEFEHPHTYEIEKRIYRVIKLAVTDLFVYDKKINVIKEFLFSVFGISKPKIKRVTIDVFVDHNTIFAEKKDLLMDNNGDIYQVVSVGRNGWMSLLFIEQIKAGKYDFINHYFFNTTDIKSFVYYGTGK